MPVDYNEYPSNWKTEIRPRILEREGNCCKWCGLENKSIVHSYKKGRVTVWEKLSVGEWYRKGCPKSVKVVLTIAHLDHDEGNHDVKDDRLAALCQLCHLRYDAKEKARRRKAKKRAKQSNVVKL
ncbi:MAG: hypothetical protein ACRBFS_19610 [Aureispira sp.]